MKLQDLFSSMQEAAKMPQVDTLMQFARSGKTDLVKTYFRRHRGCSHLHADKEKLLDGMVDDPKQYARAGELVRLLSEKFDFSVYFQKGEEKRAAALWSIHAKNPTPETAALGGRLAAEYLRFKILTDRNFKPDLKSVMSGMEAGVRLSDQMGRAAMRDSILAVQNALVSYIESEGESAPLSSGAGMLSFLKNDVPPEVSRVWMKKMTDIDIRERYHIVQGAIVIVEPRFEP